MQSTPVPSNPLLHVHTKLPITSAQVAFTWQLSVSRSHSSMSVRRESGYIFMLPGNGRPVQKHQDNPRMYRNLLRTCAVDSISFKSAVTCAYKATNDIRTGGVHMAVVCVPFTLTNVCMYRWISLYTSNHLETALHKWEAFPSITRMHRKLLTCAVDSISFKSVVAYAYIATIHIHTGGICMAVVCVPFTLINVCMERSGYILCSLAMVVPYTNIRTIQRCTGTSYVLVQLTPFPSNPLLHVHTKLPITSAQVAFTWQLSVSRSHSPMSACTGGFRYTHAI